MGEHEWDGTAVQKNKVKLKGDDGDGATGNCGKLRWNDQGIAKRTRHSWEVATSWHATYKERSTVDSWG